MKKKIVLIALTAGLSVLSCIPAFASGWQKDTVGWWYGTNENNTTWYNSGWQWVDGNNDGIAESYYFNSNGYIAVNTTVDGYTVNNDGAWTVNGIVQTKQVSLTDTSTNTSEDKTGMNNGAFGKHRGIGGSTGAQGTLNGGSTEGTEIKEKTGSELFEHKGVGGSTGAKGNLNGGSQTSNSNKLGENGWNPFAGGGHGVGGRDEEAARRGHM